MPCDGWARNPARICDQDELRLGVTTAIAGLVVGVSGLLRNANGEDSIFDMRLEPTSDRVETVLQQNIGAGHLVHCQAYVASGTPADRGIFVNARIVRESGAIDLPQMTLLSGYLDGGHQPSFPYGPLNVPSGGRGRIRSITGTNPAAGAEISEAVPAGALWAVMGMRFQLVTDATVANRRVRVAYSDDAANEIYRGVSPANQTASLTQTYSVMTNDSTAVNTQSVMVPAGYNWLLPAGFTITTATDSLQAGDNFGAPQLWVEEWLIP